MNKNLPLEGNLLNILDANQFGVSIADMNGELLYGNPALLELFQVEKEKFIGRKASDFYFDKTQRDVIVEQLQSQGFIKAIDVKLKRDDGSTFMATLSFKISQYAGENAYFCWFFDLSERMQMEAELREKDKLALHNAKLASLGELAAGIGHEVNNPLTIISGLLNFISKEVSKEEISKERVLELVEKSKLSVKRITDIVKGLKSLSRIDVDASAVFSLHEVVEETISLLREIYKQLDIRIDYKFTSDYAPIYGNRGRVQQVILNLISNAKDALKNCAEKEIKIRLNMVEDTIQLQIEDSGCGIESKHLSKIFDPFFTTKDNGEGTGIGLSMSHQIVKDHAGTIDVRSTVGKGTLFELKFDRAKENLIEVTEVGTQNIKSKRKILIVDDEKLILEYVSEIFEEHNFEVMQAENGKKALEILAENEFDIVLSDVKMPLMNGDEMLINLRENQQIKQPKFIFMTGGANIDFKDKSSNIFGLFDDYIYKPFTVDDLIQKTSALLS